MDEGGLFNEWRLTWYPRLILAGLLFGLLIGMASGDGARTVGGRLGGDFPAFYGAGWIVATGGELYSFQTQQQTQQAWIVEENAGAFIPFPYPPFFAWFYVPFSFLPYRLAFFLHTALMTAALGWGVRLLGREMAWIRTHPELAFALAVSYFPMFRSLLGGQNTPLLFLLFVGVWRGWMTGRDGLAGLCIGLLWFKPQYGGPLLGLFLLGGRWRAVMGALGMAGGLAGLSVVLHGPDWLGNWLLFSSAFAERSEMINWTNSVSWLGLMRWVWGEASLGRVILGWGPCLGAVALLGWLGLRMREARHATVVFGWAAFVLLFIQPHVLFYDMGLLLFLYAACVSRVPIGWLVVLWGLGYSQVGADGLGCSPLVGVLLGSGFLSLYWMRTGLDRDNSQGENHVRND